jgi:hypothetical protein
MSYSKPTMLLKAATLTTTVMLSACAANSSESPAPRAAHSVIADRSEAIAVEVRGDAVEHTEESPVKLSCLIGNTKAPQYDGACPSEREQALGAPGSVQE